MAFSVLVFQVAPVWLEKHVCLFVCLFRVPDSVVIVIITCGYLLQCATNENATPNCEKYTWHDDDGTLLSLLLTL